MPADAIAFAVAREAARPSLSKMGANKYLRRRRRGFLPTMALAAAAAGARVCSAIEWGETTSSTSDFVLTAAVGELTEVSWCPQREHALTSPSKRWWW